MKSIAEFKKKVKCEGLRPLVSSPLQWLQKCKKKVCKTDRLKEMSIKIHYSNKRNKLNKI